MEIERRENEIKKDREIFGWQQSTEIDFITLLDNEKIVFKSVNVNNKTGKLIFVIGLSNLLRIILMKRKRVTVQCSHVYNVFERKYIFQTKQQKKVNKYEQML